MTFSTRTVDAETGVEVGTDPLISPLLVIGQDSASTCDYISHPKPLIDDSHRIFIHFASLFRFLI